jgi:hypothetical protein
MKAAIIKFAVCSIDQNMTQLRPMLSNTFDCAKRLIKIAAAPSQSLSHFRRNRRLVVPKDDAFRFEHPEPVGQH